MSQTRGSTAPGSQSDPAERATRVPLVAAKEAFDRFYTRQYQPVVTLGFAMTGSRDVARDLAQDVFVDAFRKWDQIETPDAWVRAVLVNKSRSWMRRRYRKARVLLRLQPPASAPSPESSAEDSEFWGAVRSLPTRQAQVIALFYLDRLPAAEIGAILGISESTVRVHLTRGRRGLADQLGLEL
jgi:RNA polymerase sigma-70 factor, ECF subfamily